MTGLRGIVVVTGTDTGVGKTITTAAIAAAAGRAGLRVAVLKPAQTGIPDGAGVLVGASVPAGTSAGATMPDGGGAPAGWAMAGSSMPAVSSMPLGIPEESDVDTVIRLARPASATTMFSYPDPLAPATAARVSGRPAVELFDVVAAARSLQCEYDLVLIEGAGGLLVPMGRTSAQGERAVQGAEGRSAQWNVCDLATVLSAPMVVVTRAGLGTLNHTFLTLEALDRRGIASYVVIGSFPAKPELVHHMNLRDLAIPLDGVLPEGAGSMDSESFRDQAPSWLSALLHGTRSYDTVLP